jgi:hypothetical protein
MRKIRLDVDTRAAAGKDEFQGARHGRPIEAGNPEAMKQSEAILFRSHEAMNGRASSWLLNLFSPGFMASCSIRLKQETRNPGANRLDPNGANSEATKP